MARPTGSSRITPKGTHPRSAGSDGIVGYRQSGRWVGPTILVLLGLGTAVIVTNYLQWLPWGPSNVWILVGLGIVLAGVLLATRWH